MTVNWEEVQQALYPIKDYEDLIKRLTRSFTYPFVADNFNFSMPALINYTHQFLGGDARGRYNDYVASLVEIIGTLNKAGVKNVTDLLERSRSRQQLEAFVQDSGMNAADIARVLKYLVYWMVPGEKYLSGLIKDNPDASAAIKILSGAGIRTNLELLQRGLKVADRKSLAERCGLTEPVITDLVNRADLSRMPWSSKATISNIVGAGYGSLEALTHAQEEKLYQDFFNYGKSIGKNLKLGNEIESSFRIAKIVPKVVQS